VSHVSSHSEIYASGGGLLVASIHASHFASDSTILFDIVRVINHLYVHSLKSVYDVFQDKPMYAACMHIC